MPRKSGSVSLPYVRVDYCCLRLDCGRLCSQCLGYRKAFTALRQQYHLTLLGSAMLPLNCPLTLLVTGCGTMFCGDVQQEHQVSLAVEVTEWLRQSVHETTSVQLYKCAKRLQRAWRTHKFRQTIEEVTR